MFAKGTETAFGSILPEIDLIDIALSKSFYFQECIADHMFGWLEWNRLQM